MTDAAHVGRLLRGVLILFGVLLVATFAQSYNGRRQVVDSERAQCFGFARSVLVPQANALRADEAANALIAHDPRQPVATRRARAREFRQERLTLQQIDRRIDIAAIAGLNPVGERIVRRLGARAYSCVRAYPSASPLQFFG